MLYQLSYSRLDATPVQERPETAPFLDSTPTGPLPNQGGGWWIRTTVGSRQQIYSLPL